MGRKGLKGDGAAAVEGVAAQEGAVGSVELDAPRLLERSQVHQEHDALVHRVFQGPSGLINEPELAYRVALHVSPGTVVELDDRLPNPGSGSSPRVAGLGCQDAVASGACSFFAMMSLQRVTHSLQIKTPFGPAIMRFTAMFALPQNEQQ